MLGATGTFAVVAAAFLSARWDPEPSSGGRPLSYWVEHLSGSGFAQCYDAIRDIGPKGAPWLFHRVKTIHAVPRRWYAALYSKMPGSVQECLPTPAPAKIIEERITYALSLLDFGGVPQLQVAFCSRNPHVRRVAAVATGRMLLTDEAASQLVPGLARLVSDPDESVRAGALKTLETMERGAREATPALIQSLPVDPHYLTSADLRLHIMTIRALGRIGPEAAAAGPALARLLSATSLSLRAEVAIALWRITRAPRGVDALIADLEHNGLALCSADSLIVLGEMGPAARGAVPTLVRKLQQSSSGGFISSQLTTALETLRKIDAQEAAGLDRVQEQARVAAYVQRMQDPHYALRRDKRPIPVASP
ncbi:MAG: HEAT repeat domain-containing protein [Verrucomicrobiota bacterium]